MHTIRRLARALADFAKAITQDGREPTLPVSRTAWTKRQICDNCPPEIRHSCSHRARAERLTGEST